MRSVPYTILSSIDIPGDLFDEGAHPDSNNDTSLEEKIGRTEWSRSINMNHYHFWHSFTLCMLCDIKSQKCVTSPKWVLQLLQSNLEGTHNITVVVIYKGGKLESDG